MPTRFLRDWVAAHYADRIRALWNGENGAIAAIDIFVNGGGMPIAEVGGAGGHRREGAEERSVRSASRDGAVEVGDDKDVSAPLDPRFTFENFVVGKPNELAHAAARRVAEIARSAATARCRSTRSSSMAASGSARRI